MEIRISNTDGVPVYRQIMNQMKYMIASGRLKPGQELPAIRTLAERLVINHNTVVHAYSELEKEGLIVCRHGSGSYVADQPKRQAAGASLDALGQKIDSILSDAAHLDLDLTQLLQLILQRQAALKSKTESIERNSQ
jgi:GntR family transcriptional regulator